MIFDNLTRECLKYGLSELFDFFFASSDARDPRAMKPWTWIIFLWALSEIKTIESLVTVPGDECRKMEEEVAEADKNMKLLLYPPSVVGKWVSEKCESRPGPKFMLRSYTFYSNDSFELIQFYYNDESCSSVTYTLTLQGWYKQKKPFHSSATYTKIQYKLHSVIVVAHDIHILSHLANTFNKQCQGQTSRISKPFVEYVFQSNYTASNRDPPLTNKLGPSDIQNPQTDRQDSQEINKDKCLAPIISQLAELTKVRIQSRYMPARETGLRYELLLASIYANHDLHASSDEFQLPLILANNGSTGCFICNSVAENSRMFVHPFPAKAQLPLIVNGKWISERCEVQANELFLKRTWQFHMESQNWALLTSYYSDYTCSNLKMVHQSFGQLQNRNFSKKIPGATEINFIVQKSYLTIFETSALDAVNTHCSSETERYWQLGVREELSSSAGCPAVGLPSQLTSYDIARLDHDEFYLLYLGDRVSSSDKRPTSYKYPLVRCSPHVNEEEVSDSSTTLRPLSLSLVIASLIQVVFLFDVVL